MDKSFDAIVIGVGAMGAATCWRLAERGMRVLGIEQNGVPNALGSSHGYTRMTRSAYAEHPDYVPLVRRANELWRELEFQSGRRILHLDGALYMGAPDSPLIIGSREAADRHDVAYEMLDTGELSERFPQFRLPAEYVGMLETQAGYLRPEAGVAAMTLAALSSGAEIHGAEKVVAWDELAGGIEVHTGHAQYHAEKLILAGGPWSGRLARQIGIPLRVTRQALGWVWPRRPESFSPQKFPAWAVGRADGAMHYGFPMLPDNPGLKVALHALGDEVDPDAVERRALPSDEETFVPFLARYIPDGCGPVLAVRVCLYTSSPDGHFIVDRAPGSQRVFVACGFSGHGFKFAPVIGEALSDLASNDGTTLPIGFLGARRFGQTA